MDVSENSGAPKSSILIGVFHYKPSILGYPYFRKHPNRSHFFRCCHGFGWEIWCEQIQRWCQDGLDLRSACRDAPKALGRKWGSFFQKGAKVIGKNQWQGIELIGLLRFLWIYLYSWMDGLIAVNHEMSKVLRLRWPSCGFKDWVSICEFWWP